MGKKRLVLFIIILIVLWVISNYVYYKVIVSDLARTEEENTIVAERICDGIRIELVKAVAVSKTIANDYFLKSFLDEEITYNKSDATLIAQSYLADVRAGSQSNMAFIISDATKRYYTDTGLLKTIDPENDPHDIWYNAFCENDREFVADVDEDESDNNEKKIFINSKVFDDKDNLIGVCGVSVSVVKLQEIIRRYEDMFKIDIILTNDNGDVVIDGNDTEPQTYNIDTSAFSKSGDMVFQSETDGDFTISGYIEDTDWFIVIDHKDEESLVMRYLNDTENMTFLIGSLIIFTTVAILVFIMFGRYMSGFGAYKGVEGNYDKLTGLPNRNYFKDIYGERGVLNTTIYKSMAVFDIDYFKEANDTMNGDEILINTIRIARECFGEKSEIFRWGGDEFMMLLEWSVEFAHEMCKEFCKKVEDEGHVTISVGITEIRISDSIKRNYHRVAQGCYLVKEMGGNGVKRI